MSRVQIIGYINPICGNDETAVPCDPSLPYSTIDFFYNQQRALNPDAELTAEVQNHLVALNGVFYTFLNVTNPSKNARLSIRANPDESILFNAVTLQIDTDILIPEVNNTEGPVVRTGTSFEVQGEYLFNVIDELLNFNNPINRIAFNHDGFTLDDIEYPPSRVFIRQSRSEIRTSLLTTHEGGIVIDMDFPMLMEIRTDNTYYSDSINTISNNFITDENLNINTHGSEVGIRDCITCNQTCPPGYALVKKLQFPGLSKAWIWSCQPVVVFDDKTFGTAGAKATMVKNCGEGFDVKMVAEKYKDHPDPQVKKLVNKILNDEMEPMSLIQGGTFKSNDPQNVFLTNDEDISVVNVNCDDVIPFDGESIQKETEYIMQQNSNSINYSGSTFQQGKLINSQVYTHTQFDGTTFLIDNSQHDVTIFIPVGVISNDRYFQYKLLHVSDNKVTIRSSGLVDGKKKLILRRDGKCNHGAAKLYGFEGKILIMNIY